MLYDCISLKITGYIKYFAALILFNELDIRLFSKKNFVIDRKKLSRIRTDYYIIRILLYQYHGIYLIPQGFIFKKKRIFFLQLINYLEFGPKSCSQ